MDVVAHLLSPLLLRQVPRIVLMLLVVVRSIAVQSIIAYLSSVPFGPVTPANIVNNNCFDSGVFPQCEGSADKPLFE